MANGVILARTANTTPPGNGKWSWQVADEESDTWWSASQPTRITIPAGVSLAELCFSCRAVALAPTSLDYLARLDKNGAIYQGVLVDDGRYVSLSWTTGLIPVTPGDYFEVHSRVFGFGVPQMSADYLAFSAFADGGRLGLAVAQLTADTNTLVETALPWAVERDTLGSTVTGAGSPNLVAPPGARFAIVSLDTRKTALSSLDVEFFLTRNGVKVRSQANTRDDWALGPTAWPIAVSEGDILTVTGLGNATLSRDLTYLSVEWLGAAAAPE